MSSVDFINTVKYSPDFRSDESLPKVNINIIIITNNIIIGINSTSLCTASSLDSCSSSWSICSGGLSHSWSGVLLVFRPVPREAGLVAAERLHQRLLLVSLIMVPILLPLLLLVNRWLLLALQGLSFQAACSPLHVADGRQKYNGSSPKITNGNQY